MNLAEFRQLTPAQKAVLLTLPIALQALWHAEQGDWHQAHDLVQNAGDRDSAWVHAYLHRQEGDLSNARYWYRRSRQPESTAQLAQEWEQIVSALLTKVKT